MGVLEPVLVLLLNLAPALSVALFGWSTFALVLLYWTENLVIGAINVFKILICGFARGKSGVLQSLALAAFFAFHYGLFLVIHVLVIWSLLGPSTSDVTLAGLPGLIASTIVGDPFLFWNVILLAAFQVGQFLIGWIGSGAWRSADPYAQTFAPYGRIAVVHVAILLAAVPVALFGQPLIAVVCLALLKTALETGAARLLGNSGRDPASPLGDASA